MLAAPGEAHYQGRRDKVADAQWAAEQSRLQTQSDRDYAMELRRLEQGAEDGYSVNPIWGYNEATDSYGVFQPSKSGAASRQMEFPDGFAPLPPVTTVDQGGYNIVQDKFGIPLRSIPKTGNVATNFNVTDVDPVTGAPIAIEPRPGSKARPTSSTGPSTPQSRTSASGPRDTAVCSPTFPRRRPGTSTTSFRLSSRTSASATSRN
jgi:hypothetical protein